MKNKKDWITPEIVEIEINNNVNPGGDVSSKS